MVRGAVYAPCPRRQACPAARSCPPARRAAPPSPPPSPPPSRPALPAPGPPPAPQAPRQLSPATPNHNENIRANYVDFDSYCICSYLDLILSPTEYWQTDLHVDLFDDLVDWNRFFL